MLMRKQMILAVFIISIAFGAETEHQIIPVLFRAAADRAFMSSRVLLSLLYTLRIRPPAVNLFRIITAHIPHSKEENQEVSKGNKSHHAVGRMRHNSRPKQANQYIRRQITCKESCENRRSEINAVDNSKPFCLDRNNEKQQKLHVRISGCKGKKQRIVQV